MWSLLFLVLLRNVSGFECSDGCFFLFEHHVDDGHCDCSDCGDETDWSCETCKNGCPTYCGNSRDCISNNTAPVFTCDNGCELSAEKENNDWCDCIECEDERHWDCQTCNCPSQCPSTTFMRCGDDFGTPEFFECDDGCRFFDTLVNDHWCDCAQCEDESDWSCESCGGCPQSCGDYVECGGFMCDDNCTIAEAKLNDGFCDCGDCEDEDDFDCAKCGHCPADCGDSVDCGVQPLDTTSTTEETEEPDSAAVAVRLLLAAAISLIFAVAL